MVKRAHGNELIRSKISLPFDEAEPIRGDHVVEVALTPTDRTIAFAHACKLGSNLEPNASAVTGALVSLHGDGGIHVRSPCRLTPALTGHRSIGRCELSALLYRYYTRNAQ